MSVRIRYSSYHSTRFVLIVALAMPDHNNPAVQLFRKIRQTTDSVPVVGAVKCTWGPAYWCSTPE